MVDRLNGITVFVECVEAGGFSAAAGRLHLTRSAVAKAVARLEERLGTRLFHRTTRLQSLTKEGQAFYERCKRALEEIRAGEAMLESGRQEVAGRLRVSMPVLFGRYCVAPVLASVAREHPDLELDLSFDDRNVDLVAEGFDLCIRTGSPGAGDGLMVRRLARQVMCLCAGPGYLAGREPPASVDDLERHDLIVYGRAGRIRSWIFPQHAGEPTTITPKSRLRLDDLAAIADMATAGMGLAWLPRWLIRKRVRAGALVELWPERPSFGFDVYALWPQTPHLAYRVRVAIDTLVEAVPKLTEG